MDLRGALIAVQVIYVGIASAQLDVVDTTVGLVRGQSIPSVGITQFLGIPYAEAPEGSLRFKPPVRKARMEGIYNATSSAKICPQANAMTSVVETTMTEDCLRLDVFVPTTSMTVSENPKYPVMIWIQGGGYIVGDSTIYNPSFIVQRGQVIVVTFNYRLGVLGFLDTTDENSVGNFALRDQCSAIEWVMDNIGKFGGDVTRVTIFGESAGGSSVMQLAMSSLCKGTFNRIIAQSGSTIQWAHNRNPKKSSQTFAKYMGCPTDTSSALVTCLQSKTWQELIDAQTATLNLIVSDWVPSYSGDVFPDNPLDVYRGKDSPALRRFRSLDFLSGVCDEEGEFSYVLSLTGSNDPRAKAFNATDAILTEESFKKQFKMPILSAFPDLDDYELGRILPAIKLLYTDWKNRRDEFSNNKIIIKLYSDMGFNIDHIAFANLHSSASESDVRQQRRGKTYFYQFKPKGSWLPTYPWTQGSTHFEDIAFLFGFVNFLKSTPKEITLSNQIIEYWTNFAKTGSPNEPSLTMLEPVWPTYENETGSYIELDLDMSNDSISSFPFAQRFAFWDTYFQPELRMIRTERQKMKEKDYCEAGAKKLP